MTIKTWHYYIKNPCYLFWEQKDNMVGGLLYKTNTVCQFASLPVCQFASLPVCQLSSNAKILNWVWRIYILRGKIKFHLNNFSFLILFRDYPSPNGNILRRTQAAGKPCSFPSLPHTIPIPIPLLPQVFQHEPLTLWRTSDLELSMTSLPKPKTSLAGRNCPKYSISSTKELVSVAMYILTEGQSMSLLNHFNHKITNYSRK